MMMPTKWRIIFTPKAEKDLAKLDKPIQRDITRFFSSRILMADNPRFTGKSLVGPLKGFWRYRVGDYRILCRIEDQEMIIVAVEIGHRRDVYD